MFRPDEWFNMFIIGLCLVMALGLLVRRGNGRNYIMALFLVFISYVQLISLFITSRIIYRFPFLLYTQIPIGYALSPLIFLYIRSFLKEGKAFKTADLWHFTPVLIFIAVVLRYLFLPLNEKVLRIDSIYEGHSSFGLWAGPSISMFAVYTVIMALEVYKVFHRENPLHRRLVKIFILFSSWIILSLLKVVGVIFDIGFLWRLVSLLYSVELLIYYFVLQRYPVLLSFAHMKEEDEKPRSKSILDSVDRESLSKNIEIMMDKENLFCDEDLSLKRFSHALEISSHQLSAFLNEYYGKNFNAFVNSYRINYACDLIHSNREISILSVAFASGFNSYSAFFTAFKKETSLSPREYKTHSEEES